MTALPRPERLRAARDRMEEIDRAVAGFRDALRESNHPELQAFFVPLLDRVATIVANERDGITTTLADDLFLARSALRRMPISDLDPDLEAPTRSRKIVRGERANLVESLDNALDAVRLVGLKPRESDIDDLYVYRASHIAQLIRLDERLHVVQERVQDLRVAAIEAGVVEGRDQQQMVAAHARALDVGIKAARFETSADDGIGRSLLTDVAALARAVDAMREIADDLRETVDGLGAWVAIGVRNAGHAIAKAVDRSWRGVRAIVRTARGRRHRSRCAANAPAA